MVVEYVYIYTVSTRIHFRIPVNWYKVMHVAIKMILFCLPVAAHQA